jgi:hypothetical protein
VADVVNKAIKLKIHKGGISSRDSSLGIATGYGMDDHGGREFESQ